MSKTNTAQLALLDLPAPERRSSSPKQRRELSPEATTQHVSRLLAELDRAVVAHHARSRQQPPRASAPRLTPAQEARMQHLARLFEAIENVHASSENGAAENESTENESTAHIARRPLIIGA